MFRCVVFLMGLLISAVAGAQTRADAGAAMQARAVDLAGEPVLEEPTFHCLGAYWIVPGTQPGLRIDMEYRQVGQEQWKKSLPMFRVRSGDTTQRFHDAELNPAEGTTLFAGSIVGLQPGTEYELRLTPVGQANEANDPALAPRVLRARTAAEPTEPPGMIVRHVVPGKGGGDGSEQNPYRGLSYAQSEARPGMVFLLHKGVYEGTFHVTRSGRPGAPIIWRAAGDGEVILDGAGTQKLGIDANNVDDVWFERLTIRGFYLGISVFDSSRLVIRRCRIADVQCGIYCMSSDSNAAERGGLPFAPEGGSPAETLPVPEPPRSIYILDNDLEGPFTWGVGPTGASVIEHRGIQITGTGHVVAYNRVSNFKDGIDTFPSRRCSAIDIHNNEILNCKDDGIEMDYSERNNRCFNNRITNAHQGITEQPVYGGPVYIFRNALYNIAVAPFKLHHVGNPAGGRSMYPSGVILFHNTIVKRDEPWVLLSAGPVYNCVSRNNLFVGGGRRAANFDPPMVDCDFDYDGFAGGPWEVFMKWNRVFYQTVDEVHAKAPVQRHASHVELDGLFASGARRPEDTDVAYAPMDLRLNPQSPAADAGEPLPGFNDGFAGKGPSLGAYEVGQDLPHYGPRPE